MTRKILLGVAALAAFAPAMAPPPAGAVVSRSTLIEEFGYLT